MRNNYQLSTHFTLAMMRAVYLATRIYLGLVIHFGRIATIIAFLMTALTTAALPQAMVILAVTVVHFFAMKLLDAGYRRATAAVVRSAKAARAPAPAPLKKATVRAAKVAQTSKAAPLRITRLQLSNFSHLHG